MKRSIIASISLILFIDACSGSDTNTNTGAPGDSCTPTEQGAAEYQSQACATVTCTNSLTNVQHDRFGMHGL